LATIPLDARRSGVRDTRCLTVGELRAALGYLQNILWTLSGFTMDLELEPLC
jgi:hypothetical protein